MTTPTERPNRSHDDAHVLLPTWLAAQIPALYSQEHVSDPTIRAKFFTPDSSWTWYVTEYDPTERRCFGLVDGFEKELGYFSLDELEQVRGPLGLRIERDLWYTAQPLSAVRGADVDDDDDDDDLELAPYQDEYDAWFTSLTPEQQHAVRERDKCIYGWADGPDYDTRWHEGQDDE